MRLTVLVLSKILELACSSLDLLYVADQFMVELSLWLLQRYLTAIRKDFLVSSSVSCETVLHDNRVGAYYLRGTAAYHHVQV